MLLGHGPTAQPEGFAQLRAQSTVGANLPIVTSQGTQQRTCSGIAPSERRRSYDKATLGLPSRIKNLWHMSLSAIGRWIPKQLSHNSLSHQMSEKSTCHINPGQSLTPLMTSSVGRCGYPLPMHGM